MRIALPLLKWFDHHQRPMPWRATRDAYRIWVSEVMLQQTTVAAVIPYYHRFMAAFPTVTAVAAAPEQDVLKLWEGLGYYRRARHLHAAAKRIVNEHDGQFPNDRDAVAALPGVGRYILGAVLSQAFEERLPIVEANTVRLLARLFAYRGDPRAGKGNAWAWRTAESLLPQKRIGDFNQALMELGSQVCTPVNPKCDACPLRKQCQTFEQGLQTEIPPPKTPPRVVTVHEIALTIRKGKQYLMLLRSPQASRWANMWEFPHGELMEGEAAEKAAMRVANELTGLTVAVGRSVAVIQHTVTRFAITMTVLEATTRARRVRLSEHAEVKWLTLAEMKSLPMAVPQRRIVTALANPQKSLL
ncbi:A/G-specific adenine glycosylase [soil metagenome]